LTSFSNPEFSIPKTERKSLNGLIVDDREDSREKLEFLIQKYFPEIELLPSCSSGKEGLMSISENQPQIVFLDIELGDMTAFEMLERLDKINFYSIFCTAYDQYAIKAIRFNALDYLVKPINREELNIAISRLYDNWYTINKDLIASVQQMQKPEKQDKIDRIALQTKDGLIFKDLKNIIHLDAERNYTFFHFDDKQKMLVSRPLKDYEDLLITQGFFRVHHSHIVNLQHIQQYIRGDGGYVIMSNGKAISVARNKKEDFLDLFDR
jgi:two-component system LytT family response regulator